MEKPISPTEALTPPETALTIEKEKNVKDDDILMSEKNKSDDKGSKAANAENDEEDFEAISDGTFEVDDSSQATSIVPTADDNDTNKESTKNEKEQNESINEEKYQDENKIEIKDDETTESQSESNKETEFEEVDAKVFESQQPEESNVLGESDMTLPADAENTSISATEKDETTPMEVDEDADDKKSLEDIEMASDSASPAEKEKKDAADAVDAAADHEETSKGDDSIESENVSQSDEPVKSPNDSANIDNAAAGEDVVDKSTDASEKQSDTNDGDLTKETTQSSDDHVENIESTQNQQPDDEEIENDHGDETVENVQEPEESDVCLIPDDTEKEVTAADKQQAILARENAEKECELAEQKEKKSTSVDGNKDDPQLDNPKTAAGDAPVTQIDAEAIAVVQKEEINQSMENTEEPLLEEMHSEPVETGGAVQKIIISWIVSAVHECIQCKEEKICGFRFKNPETGKIEFVCEQACTEAIVASSPGKYFIRHKKFLVEELPTTTIAEDETTNSTDKDGKNGDDNDGDVGDADVDDDGVVTGQKIDNKHNCLQCKETKECKYFFKQDDDTYYVCNDDCFNLLTSAEPDKFKLKRHSIRVRNIGPTTISSEAAACTTITTTSPSSSSTTSNATTNSGGTKSNTDSRVVARTAAEAEAARLERVASFTRRCAECFAEVTLGEKNLLWETMDFCNELCLGKYQRSIGAQCQTCQGEVPHQSLGKYCVRFGFDIRQFCCAGCLNEYKKGLKTCSCCQRDISSGGEGFLAPVGDKEQFKDFCSQACMRRYDSMLNPKKKLRNDHCAVCTHEKPVRVEIVLDEKEHNFCSNPCFSAFKFVSNIVADQCGMCCKYFERKGSESFTIYTEKRAKVFCSRICLNVYIIVNRKIVSCQWCKVKKYNFDMIYKQQDNQEVLMCSLNCLTLYGVSINAFSRTVAKCDNCNTCTTPQYHLTMSDASMRNFCTYQCVMQFQSQFARTPLTLDTEASASQQVQQQVSAGGGGGAPFPTGLPKRVKLKVNQQGQSQPPVNIKLPIKNSSAKKGPTVPVISTVSSLASGETENMMANAVGRRSRGRSRKYVMDDSPPPQTQPISSRGRPRRIQNIDNARSPTPPSPPPSPPPMANQKSSSSSQKMKKSSSGLISSSTASSSRQTSASPMNQDRMAVQTETKILTVPPYPPIVRNVQTSCKPQTQSVGTDTPRTMVDAECQTEKDYSNKVLIPVPVPLFIPTPMAMYSLPCPIPVPFPLPIPVPVFIPTTRNSANGIMKEIKKIQDKMPTDPFEAELLMMAELVAEDKDESGSDSDDETAKTAITGEVMQYGVVNNVVPPVSNTVEVGNNSSYGEDVLQMALKMASGDYEEPADLETAMTANTITNPPPGMVATTHDENLVGIHQMQQQTHQIMDNSQRGGRGRKRGSATSPNAARNNRSPVKRQRVMQHEIESATAAAQQQQPTQPVPPAEKPDANMCLKYTFGVNAWKQWVMTKNADIEKSSIRRRTFKTDLLQMTADELNYSLCLFVKEVRKPNGTEYAPDTIYYLVLGIQQYLYESGRIDNIFTDPYYERFTDCLDEVARKFSVLYNDSQYIVTRVEEEHLWECKQLGAHSPHVLLSTLMFFNTKHFNLTTVEEHMQLSFSHIMKHWKRSAHNTKSPGTRNVLLRFYPPQAGLDANPRKKKVYEQQENEENPLRCPVRLYEFYLSKCPESVKTRNDVFYLQPERSCVPDSPVWYSTQALSQESLQKMLHRVKMVKEINIALLTS